MGVKVVLLRLVRHLRLHPQLRVSLRAYLVDNDVYH
jgi:hypothetical protein